MEIVDPGEVRLEVESAMTPRAELVDAIEAQAAQNVRELMALDLSKTDEKRKMLKTIEEFASDTLQSSARRSALFGTTIANFSESSQSSSLISAGLADLHREIKALDPSNLDFTRGGLLGRLLNPIHRYFEKYERADGTIQEILTTLERGKATLRNDNTTLDLEEDYLREVTRKLSAELKLGIALVECIQRQMSDASFADEEKRRFVDEEILFPLQRRIADMQQMAMVNYQGIIAMSVVKRSNKELIRGVDRARTVTVTALRTAVMVAGALYNQKIVLRQVDALNAATEDIIAQTGKMLRQQGAAMQARPMDAGISPEVLKRSFRDVIDTINDISTFKQRALPGMQESIAQFRALAEAGEAAIARLDT